MYEPATYRKEAKIIGYAGMAQDGTILMRLRSSGSKNSSTGVKFFSPGDERYAEVFAHLAIGPGQTEPIKAALASI